MQTPVQCRTSHSPAGRRTARDTDKTTTGRTRVPPTGKAVPNYSKQLSMATTKADEHAALQQSCLLGVAAHGHRQPKGLGPGHVEGDGYSVSHASCSKAALQAPQHTGAVNLKGEGPATLGPTRSASSTPSALLLSSGHETRRSSAPARAAPLGAM